MSVHFFALSRRTKDKHDWIKFFDTFESQIMVFVNIFAIKIVLKNTFIWNQLYCSKTVTFWNKGTFVRTAPMQEVSVLSKWNNTKSLDKGFPYV